MNCPYCDETIHPQAKFCAKCGLPLKEDTTVHGVSAGDDAGPSKYVIGALLGGIAIIGLLIFVLGNQKPAEQQVRQQTAPPRMPAPPGMGSGVAGTMPSQPAFNNTQAAARPALQAPRGDANTGSQTRYAYTPPTRMTMPAASLAPDTVAPPVPLLVMTTADPPRAPRVTIDRGTTPPVPALPDSVAMAAIPTMPDELEPTVEDGERVNPNPRLYVWDPVHERWARRQDAPRRRSTTRTRGTGRFNPIDANRYAFPTPTTGGG